MTLFQRSRESLQCLGILGLSIAFWFQDYFLHGWTFLSEAGQMLWADWVMVHGVFGRWHVPEWNPLIAFGVDYAGREAFFNPLNLGSLLGFFFNNPKTGFMVLTMLSLLGMGFSAYTLLRHLGIRHAYALMGSIMYTLAPKWVDDGYHGPRFLLGYVFLPLVLLLLTEMYKTGFQRFRHYVWLSVLLALMYLSYGAVFLMISGYLLGSFLIYLLFLYVREQGWGKLGKPVMYGGGSLLLLLGLVAYILLPFLASYHFNQRSLFSAEKGYDWWTYLGIVFPWINRIFSPTLYDVPYPPPLPLFAPNIYFYTGVLTVPVLLYGIIHRAWDTLTRFFVFFPIAVLVIWNDAFSRAIPLLPALERLTKGMQSGGFIHVTFILSFAIAVASILEHRARGSLRPVRYADTFRKALSGLNYGLMALYAGAFLVFLAGGLAWHSSMQTRLLGHALNKHAILLNYYFRTVCGIFLIVFAARFKLLWIFQRRGIPNTRTAMWVLVLMIIDFQCCFRIWYPFTDMDARYRPDSPQNAFILGTKPLDRLGGFHYQIRDATGFKEFLEQKAEQNPEKLKQDVHQYFFDGFSRPLYEPSFTFFPLTISRSFYGFHESLMPAYFWDFDQTMNRRSSAYVRQSWMGLWDPHSPLLNTAGIQYICWHKPVEDPRLIEELQYRGYVGSSRIYRNRSAVPRTYLTHQIGVEPDRQQLLHRINRPDFNPRTITLTEEPDLKKAGLLSLTSKRLDESVQIQSYEPDHIIVSAKTRTPALLVLNDMYHPNWSATVNQAKSQIYRVNAVFRGVLLTPGEHQVEFQYRNAAFHQGVWISLICWALVLCYFLIWRKVR